MAVIEDQQPVNTADARMRGRIPSGGNAVWYCWQLPFLAAPVKGVSYDLLDELHRIGDDQDKRSVIQFVFTVAVAPMPWLQRRLCRTGLGCVEWVDVA